MKRDYLILVIAVILIAFSSVCFAVGYSKYINKNYNYSIIIPDSWKQEELTLSNKHFMYALKDTNTEIKVRAFRSSDDTVDKMIHDKTWNLRKIDPGLDKILETGQIKIRKNVTGKLLIFDYKSNNNRFLQRALITKNNGIIYIIECKSPQNTFYKYEDIFTTALASFKYLQGGEQLPSGTIEKTEESKENEGLEEITPESIGEDEKI